MDTMVDLKELELVLNDLSLESLKKVIDYARSLVRSEQISQKKESSFSQKEESFS